MATIVLRSDRYHVVPMCLLRYNVRRDAGNQMQMQIKQKHKGEVELFTTRCLGYLCLVCSSYCHRAAFTHCRTLFSIVCRAVTFSCRYMLIQQLPQLYLRECTSVNYFRNEAAASIVARFAAATSAKKTSQHSSN